MNDQVEVAPGEPVPPQRVAGLVAEFDDPEALKEAAEAIRDAGYRRWDTHTPFPVHGIDRAMGIRPTILPWLVFGAGLTGATVAMLLQWWTNAIDYPYIISGKPLFSVPANIPVAFELIVLFSAFTAFLATLALNGLPRFSHPVFSLDRFRRATNDRFFLSIDAADAKFSEAGARQLLEPAGPLAVELCYEDARPARIPRAIPVALLVLGALAVLPPLLVAGYRAAPKRSPRIHPLQDMVSQPKYLMQSANPFFVDGAAARPQVAGTIPRDRLQTNGPLWRGQNAAGEWIGEFPLPVTMERMRRGRERYGIYCSACHGLAGEGDGMAANRWLRRGEWQPPLSLHADSVRTQPVGQIYNTITNGVRTMPPYASQIPVEDRWAIAMYVRALQRSQSASLDDVPPDLRSQLRQ